MRFAEYATRTLPFLQEDGMGNGRTNSGSHRFATMCAVVLPMLSLPNSNEDSETVFSSVQQTYTDSQETIFALLSCKLNTEDICFQFQPEVCRVGNITGSM